jgi:hypothetical protein
MDAKVDHIRRGITSTPPDTLSRQVHLLIVTLENMHLDSLYTELAGYDPTTNGRADRGALHKREADEPRENAGCDPGHELRRTERLRPQAGYDVHISADDRADHEQGEIKQPKLAPKGAGTVRLFRHDRVSLGHHAWMVVESTPRDLRCRATQLLDR